MSDITTEEMTNFEYIWDKWIVPLVSDLSEQMDKKFVEYCGVKTRDITSLKLSAERYYQKRRMELKKIFYGEYEKGMSNDDHRMDFHKIAALICRTMIEYKVFIFDVERCKQYADKNIDEYNTDWVVKNALVNFRLAFYSSIVFLYQSMLYTYSSKDEKIFGKLQQKKCLDLYNADKKQPSANTVQESFENCIVLDLAKRDIANRSFDDFMYAIIMYQLEEHNIHLL